MILNFKDDTTWKPLISKALSDILGNCYTTTIINNADQIKYRDSIEEACSLFHHIISEEKLIDVVSQVVLESYTEIFTYHACRTNNVNSYYENGIIPLAPPEAHAEFREKFCSIASQQEIDSAIAAVSTQTREGVVHTAVDDRVFFESSGHYLIYGGEYLHCLAVHLPGDPQKHRDILKEHGKATVLVCKLPFSVLSEIDCLVQFMLADHFFRIAHSRDEVIVLDHTIFMSENIQPKYIVSHYHPTRIVDTFMRRMIWNEQLKKYE